MTSQFDSECLQIMYQVKPFRDFLIVLLIHLFRFISRVL